MLCSTIFCKILLEKTTTQYNILISAYCYHTRLIAINDIGRLLLMVYHSDHLSFYFYLATPQFRPHLGQCDDQWLSVMSHWTSVSEWYEKKVALYFVIVVVESLSVVCKKSLPSTKCVWVTENRSVVITPVISDLD